MKLLKYIILLSLLFLSACTPSNVPNTAKASAIKSTSWQLERIDFESGVPILKKQGQPVGIPLNRLTISDVSKEEVASLKERTAKGDVTAAEVLLALAWDLLPPPEVAPIIQMMDNVRKSPSINYLLGKFTLYGYGTPFDLKKGYQFLMDASEGGCDRAFLERFDYNFGLIEERYGLGQINKEWTEKEAYNYQIYLDEVEKKHPNSPEILARRAKLLPDDFESTQRKITNLLNAASMGSITANALLGQYFALNESDNKLTERYLSKAACFYSPDTGWLYGNFLAGFRRDPNRWHALRNEVRLALYQDARKLNIYALATLATLFEAAKDYPELAKVLGLRLYLNEKGYVKFASSSSDHAAFKKGYEEAKKVCGDEWPQVEEELKKMKSGLYYMNDELEKKLSSRKYPRFLAQ